jgi:phosphoribosylamine---glycine ligase
MRVLLIGGGGREHAMCWAISRSPRVEEIACMPGNAGIAGIARIVPGDPEDVGAVANLAEQMGADLTVVGPEAPLVAGLADELRRRGLKVVGHNRSAAMLEGSKIVAKQFMARNDIPTARFSICHSAESARAALRLENFGLPVVIKADGLAAGKGVRIATTLEEADEAIQAFMVDRELGEAGAAVLVEEALVGREASLIYFTDGTRVVPVPPAQDYKRVGDGDAGPNTGGMGSFSVNGLIDAELERRVMEEITEPTVRRMREEGNPLSGILYVGLMLTVDGPKVLEYNLRFGDPETQSILARLDSDIVDVFEGIAKDSLEGVEVAWSDDPALCLVLASAGYPGPYAKGKAIEGLDEAGELQGVTVFHAGTALGPDGTVVTSGGRVLGVTARAATLQAARERAYAAAERIRFEGKTNRTDIGADFLPAEQR